MQESGNLDRRLPTTSLELTRPCKSNPDPNPEPVALSALSPESKNEPKVHPPTTRSVTFTPPVPEYFY
jgi:hypothetical protein